MAKATHPAATALAEPAEHWAEAAEALLAELVEGFTPPAVAAIQRHRVNALVVPRQRTDETRRWQTMSVHHAMILATHPNNVFQPSQYFRQEIELMKDGS